MSENTPTPINAETLTAALEAVVAERGADYIYPVRTDPNYALEWVSHEYSSKSEEYGSGCRYIARDGSPGCIFGAALVHLGYEPADPDTDPAPRTAFPLEGNRIGAWLDTLLPKDADFETKDDVLKLTRAADEAQAIQDGGQTWGEALEAFKGAL